MDFKTLDELKISTYIYDRYEREQICDDVSKIYNGYKNIDGNKCKRENGFIGIFLGKKDSDPMCLLTMDAFTHHFLCGYDVWKKEAIIRIMPKLEDANKYYTNGLPRYVTKEVYEEMYLKGKDEWLINILDFSESKDEEHLLDEDLEK